jgi:hypothetical protein
MTEIPFEMPHKWKGIECLRDPVNEEVRPSVSMNNGLNPSAGHRKQRVCEKIRESFVKAAAQQHGAKPCLQRYRNDSQNYMKWIHKARGRLLSPDYQDCILLYRQLCLRSSDGAWMARKAEGHGAAPIERHAARKHDVQYTEREAIGNKFSHSESLLSNLTPRSGDLPADRFSHFFSLNS